MLELIESLGSDEEWMRLELQAIDLLLTNGWRFGNVGEPERLRAERGIALAEHLGERDALSSVAWGYAISLSCDGQYEAAEGPARRASTCRLRARISQARVLRALDDADLMLEQSAAYGYGPMIAEERARLAIVNGAAPREQLRPLVARYGEVGAIGHVRRLEAELGA